MFTENLKTTLLFLIILSLLANGCSDDTPVSIDDTEYVPVNLENSTWEMMTDIETEGWSADILSEAKEFSSNLQTAAVMVIHKGKVVYHWGDLERKFWTHSCRKSFMSALYGQAITESKIDYSKTMAELGIDDENPTLNDTEKTATVKMLLQARSGVYHEAAAEAASMKAARPARNSHEPGTFWYYNNWDFKQLLTIYEQETNTKFFEQLNSKIFKPIGTEDFQVADGQYQLEDVSIHPAYPFRLSARDMARFGQLFLNKGVWKGERIISETWIDESTFPYSDTGNGIGYGYMWWVINEENLWAPKGSYFAAGYGGQYCLVIPSMDVVIVHRVNTDQGHYVTGMEFSLLVQFLLSAKTN